MRKLESKEIKGNIFRFWSIQKLDLKTIEKFGLKVPDSLKSDMEFNFNDSIYEFYKYSDPLAYSFISSQYWFVDEWEIAEMNLFEINLTIKEIEKEKNEILAKIVELKNKEELENLKVDLILNENKYLSFLYIKRKKEENLKIKRK